MGDWIGAQDKQIAWTAIQFADDLSILRSDAFPPPPMNQEKIQSL